MDDPRTVAIMQILLAEQSALVSGQYEVLDTLLPQKQTIFDTLDRPFDMRDGQKIAGLLAQNERLLAAAIKGFRAARDRIDVVRKVRDGLQVYDQSGQFAAPSLQRPDLVKKA